MSSSTAALRIVCASRLRAAPASLSTRALMPMLVAVIAAATKRCIVVLEPGMAMAAAAQPATSVPTVPRTATRAEAKPTRTTSPMVNSRPTSKSKISTPMRASISMFGSDFSP